jgi:hypothetical protein
MGLDSVSGRDLEYQELERHDLLTGEPRYVEDEIRNSNLSIAFGALAAVSTLVAMILGWVLYFRDRNYSFLWHPIWLIGAFLFSLACIAWAFGAGSAIKTGRQPNSLFTLIIFLGSLLLMGYMVVTALWYVFYRVIHYDFLVGLRTDINLWNHRMVSGSSFQDGWTGSRRLIWWTVFFTLLAGAAFAFLAYASRSIVWNRYQMTRFGLYWALAWIVLSSWLVLYWTRQANGYKDFFGSSTVDNVVLFLRILAIILLVYAFVNTVVNLLKMRLGYFLMGLLGIALLVLLTCASALVWREVRERQRTEQTNADMSNCATTLNSIHENDVSDWCPAGGKYLAAGQTCGKEFLVQRWEGNNEIRSLNPACCLSAKHFYIFPYMMLGYWSLVLTIATAIATVCNFYLGDTTEYLSNANKTLSIGDYIFLALILLLFIGWGIYFLVRKYRDFTFNNRGNYYGSYMNPGDAYSNNNNKVGDFERVPGKVIREVTPVVNNTTPQERICYGYNTSSLYNPTFNTNYPGCTDPNTCTMRLAIGSVGGTMNVLNDGGATRAGADNRYNFFPDCNTLNSYYMFYGNQAQLRSLLSNLQICTNSPAVSPTLYIYSDQQPTNRMTSSGLTNQETPASFSGTSNCNNQFTEGGCGAATQCRYRSSFQGQFQPRIAKGRYYYIKDGQKRFDIPNTISFEAYVGNTRVGANETVLVDGIFFATNVPRYTNSSYVLSIITKDSSNQFLTRRNDYLVTPDASANDILLGEIRLDTRDGTICPYNDSACITRQTRQNGNINVFAADGASYRDTNTPLNDATFKLFPDHTTVYDNPFKTITSDSDGGNTFTAVPYGPYTIVASKPGYNPVIQTVDLQEQSISPSAFVMIPVNSTDYGRIVMDTGNTNVDYDLVLQMKSDGNAFCEVSPYNKYCPWTGHLNDVTSGPGEETIIIRRLAIANYNTFVRSVPPYDKTCAAGQVIKDNAYHYRQIQWSHVQGNSANRFIVPGLIRTRTFMFPFWGIFDFLAALFRAFPVGVIVETPAEAQRNRTVINYRGNPLAPGNMTSPSTFPPSGYIPPTESNTTNNTCSNCTNCTLCPGCPQCSCSVCNNCTMCPSCPQCIQANGTNLTNVTNSSNVSNVTNGTNLTNVTNATNVSNVTNGTNLTNVTNGTNVTNVTNGTNVSNVTNGTNVSNVTNGTNATNVTNGTNVSNVTNGTNVSNVTNGTNATNVTNGTNVTNVYVTVPTATKRHERHQ